MVYGEKEMTKKLTWKIWLLIIILILSFTSIFGLVPKFFDKGVLITSIESNSTAFEQGLRQGQIITEIDGQKINNLNDFSKVMQGKFAGETTKTILTTKNSEIILFSKTPPEITVSDIPKTNIKLGLDLSGGSRALIQAQDQKLSSSEINDLVDITSNRFNEFGISDINVRPVTDLSGNNFMSVEIAGATPKDLEDILAKQGKFEAKISNETVFIGGKDKDIASVCREDATCSGIESCDQTGEGAYACRFKFAIYLSESAATRHAQITDKLSIDQNNSEYLSEKLDLYLDDNLVDSLFIGKELKGRVTTQVQVSGAGAGETKEDAYNNAKESMHKLQTILITGSLPYKLEIVKLDTISPVLGKEFIRSILIAGLAAFVAVSIVVFVRYKKLKSCLFLLITSASEVITILGIAAFISWNLDLPSIAGIIATIGTGIDQQIIILDEAKQTVFLSIKQKLKRAFAIILGAYFTSLVSLLPLLWASAGLLKGFSVTTIIGITVGVLITRPAFTDMVKGIEE